MTQAMAVGATDTQHHLAGDMEQEREEDARSYSFGENVAVSMQCLY